MISHFPLQRHRRKRSTPWIRDLFAEHAIHPSQFIAPIFVSEVPHDSGLDLDVFPGLRRYAIDELPALCEQLQCIGIKAMMLFPVIYEDKKDEMGTEALNPDSLIYKAIRKIKSQNCQLSIMADVALDPYTSHGHDGVIGALHTKFQDVDNTETVKILSSMALLLAEAGTDFVCPSDMMDGRILDIRNSLEAHGYTQTLIASYAVKYASSFYQPFRNALGSNGLKTLNDKKTYQMDYRNSTEALSECMFDEAEGADCLIVKPGLMYLDIVSKVKEKTSLPIISYHVSGEYVMQKLSAHHGYLDDKQSTFEIMHSFIRAGCSNVITYSAIDICKYLKNE